MADAEKIEENHAQVVAEWQFAGIFKIKLSAPCLDSLQHRTGKPCDQLTIDSISDQYFLARDLDQFSLKAKDLN